AWLVHAAPEQALAFAQDVYGLHERDPALGVAAVLARNWLPMFLVLPIFLPILLAAQSIGGERERRTLEPLLATPVSTLSIILGKSIAALVPAMLITWVAAALFCAGIDLVVGRALLPDGAWLFGTLALSALSIGRGCSPAGGRGLPVLEPRQHDPPRHFHRDSARGQALALDHQRILHAVDRHAPSRVERPKRIGRDVLWLRAADADV